MHCVGLLVLQAGGPALQLPGGKLNSDCCTVNIEIYSVCNRLEHNVLALNCQMNIIVGIRSDIAADLFSAGQPAPRISITGARGFLTDSK